VIKENNYHHACPNANDVTYNSICWFAGACSEFPALWELKFYFWFRDQTNNIIVPLSSFASDENGLCKLYVVELEYQNI
jgi:hypothetical protein